MVNLGANREIPYMRDEVIEGWAAKFVKDKWNKEYPIDVEEICDNLNISVIPIIGLRKQHSIDAYTSGDFQTIYVDDSCFNNNIKRCRFSIAHELGHITLHKKYYPKKITSKKDLIKYSEKYSSGKSEYQANMFAACILVPREKLNERLRMHFGDDVVYGIENSSSSEKADAYADITKYFQVSDEVIIRRLNKIYPELLKRLG